MYRWIHRTRECAITAARLLLEDSAPLEWRACKHSFQLIKNLPHLLLVSLGGEGFSTVASSMVAREPHHYALMDYEQKRRDFVVQNCHPHSQPRQIIT